MAQGLLFYNISLYSRSQVSVYRTIGPLVKISYGFVLISDLYFCLPELCPNFAVMPLLKLEKTFSPIMSHCSFKCMLVAFVHYKHIF